MKNKVILFFLILVNLTNWTYPQEEDRVFSGRYCTVFYEKDVDLRMVNRSIALEFSDFYRANMIGRNSDLSIEGILTEKFDTIFNKVQGILDMYPSNIKVIINIYKDKTRLNKIYEEIFKGRNTLTSFYIYNTNTIYTTESEINENVLAHEMAHCIIDHYFVILPSPTIQEILAAYTDVHLED